MQEEEAAKQRNKSINGKSYRKYNTSRSKTLVKRGRKQISASTSSNSDFDEEFENQKFMYQSKKLIKK